MFTEGPVWHPDGYLLFVDLHRNLIFRLAPCGQPEVVRANSGRSNGLTLDLQGRLIMCESDNGRVTRMADDGKITPLAERWEGKRLKGPNDVVCRSDGSIYFTNPGGNLEPSVRAIGISGVHRIAPDGTLSVVISDMEFPNGLAFSPDEGVLYVSNSQEAMHAAAFDVRADGSVANGRVFADMSSDESDGVPDGMKVDAEGRVYCTGPGGCWVFDSSGKRLGLIRLPEIPANCAWGGPENRTMFFTARSSVYSVRMRDSRYRGSECQVGCGLSSAASHVNPSLSGDMRWAMRAETKRGV